MFRIESYIASVILSNADRYIRNFRKQDAQISLWEGDAAFHNIDLNVEALNEEFQSPFVVISGYIHDLIIHVPWTKLMSEPVTISVNTIECVMRLKSKDEQLQTFPKTKNLKNDERSIAESAPQSSYTSALINKIMNNLSIRCVNVILKLVEEDIVFSMNIEKLEFDNADDSWNPTMTDFNTDKLLTRKLITLSGLTICLDKQNSSGRIETYMEPLLYKCLIHIRILRAYHRSVSRSAIYSHFDIMSNRMSFTLSEPQISMLLKLAVIIFGINTTSTHKDNNTLSAEENFSISTNTEETFDGNEIGNINETWSNWLWNMVPAILSQDDEDDLSSKEEISPVHHIGFCIENVDLIIKIWDSRSKYNVKREFRSILECRFAGTFYQMTVRNTEWLNLRFGINYAGIGNIIDANDNRMNQVLYCGVDNTKNFHSETLFDENYKFHSIRMHQKDEQSVAEDEDDSNLSSNDEFDFMYNLEFSLNTHLKNINENILFEKSPGFVFDYVKSCGHSRDVSNTSDVEIDYNVVDGKTSVHSSDAETDLEKSRNSVITRFLLGSTVVKFTSDFINKITYLHKVIESEDFFNYRRNYSHAIDQNYDRKFTYKTHFTSFDVRLEFHMTSLSSLNKENKFSDIPETNSSCNSPPILIFFCKCIDGETNYTKNFKMVTIKAAEFVCSLLQGNEICDLLKCEKIDWKCSKNLHNQFLDLHVDFRQVLFKSSRPNLLLAYYISNYLWYTFRNSEEKNNFYVKIFFSSLIDDSLLPDNTILEVFVETLTSTYQSLEKTYAFEVLIDQCEAYANKLRNNVSKKIVIFSADENNVLPDPIKLRFQRSSNSVDDFSYPSYVRFSIGSIKINLDPIFYSWLNYQAVPNVSHKPVSKTNKIIKDNTLTNKSVTSRKVSEGSSGSYSRKYANAYPKPKESVHSSGDPETQSPPNVTETEPSDMFQTADTTFTHQPRKTFIQSLAGNLRELSTFIVHGSVTNMTIYIPTLQTESVTKNNDMELLLMESLRKNSNDKTGVFVLFFKMIKVKCDFPISLLDDLGLNVLLAVGKDVWPTGKSSSSWDISINDICVDTLLEENLTLSMLKPFSTSCTVGVSFRNNERNEIIAALCVHFDFQPLCINLTSRQVLLISSAIDLFNTLLQNSNKVVPMDVGEELCIKSPSTNTSESGSVKKLTGWIQWTFTKCSLNIYHEKDNELAKLSLEAEDSIVSLEFDDIFHKLKIKLTSFGVYHHEKNSDCDSWKNGPFCGALIQRYYPQPSSTVKEVEDDMDDRFLLATITRARSSNLSFRLTSSNTTSDIQISPSSDHYVTEIILDVCSVDVILPLIVIQKFLSVLKPLIDHLETTPNSDSNTFQVQTENEKSYSCLPLTYFNIPVLRIFIPLSECLVENFSANYNTVICEVHKVTLDFHPKNPILRRQGCSKFLQSSCGKRYGVIEQKLQGQQYQLSSESVSVQTGPWTEIEKIIVKEQLLVKGPPSVLEQNPAVMWNQGYHLTDREADKNHFSPIFSNFSCHIQFAPSIKCHSLRTMIQGPQLEISVLTDLDVSVSIPQICLLIALHKEYLRLISPMFVSNKKETNVSSTFFETPPCKDSSLQTIDSGIDSSKQNSVVSSTISKSKSEIQTPDVHQSHLKSKNSSISLSHMPSIRNKTERKIFFDEIFITTSKINLTFYRLKDTKEVGPSSSFVGLFFCKIVQPYVSISNENGYYGVQVEIFNMSVRIPDLSCSFDGVTRIPNRADFPLEVLQVRKYSKEPYSQITNAFLSIKALQNMRKRWKVEYIIGQPLFVNSEMKIIQYFISTLNLCYEDFHESGGCFDVSNQNSEVKAPNLETQTSVQVYDKLLEHFSSFSSLDMRINRLVLVCKSENTVLLLNTDSIDVHVKPPNEIKTQSESVSVICDINSIAISLPKTDCKNLDDILSKGNIEMKKRDFFSNLVLKPWNVKVEIMLVRHRSNVFRNKLWKCLKIDSENISLNLSPVYVEKLSEIIRVYTSNLCEYFHRNENEKENVVDVSAEDKGAEYYKDDLRAGAFQYIKINEDKNDTPLPYEVHFCNRPLHPYMSWRYPQARILTKLQIYPILVEDVSDDLVENKIHCQLQYYNEMTMSYESYVSFNLCENLIQNITLPSEKPRIIAAECWRIVLFDFVNSLDNYDIKMDIKSLVGYVRVDSVFKPTYVPEMQFLINISEIQCNFYSLCYNSNMVFDNYFVDYLPTEQCFLCIAYGDAKISMSSFQSEKVIKFTGTGKASILNYEYLMLQSFVDPFTFEALLYYTDDLNCKLAAVLKTIRIRISAQFVHTLSVAQALWNNWKSNAMLPWKMMASYIICNNTNQLITFRQEDTSREIFLSPYWCHLFAWSSSTATKLLRLSVFCGKKQFISNPFSIRTVGCEIISCKSEDGENCTLNINIVQLSSVVNQIIIRGNLLVYNVLQSDMGIRVISHGKNVKNKLSSAEILSTSRLMKRKLVSVVLPLEHRLVFKIRFNSTQTEDGTAQWSGIIPLNTSPKNSNQTSWLVKIPLTNHKEHFQSVWCQLTFEMNGEFPLYLVVFRPLCSLISFLPWESHFKVFNELGVLIDTGISSRGQLTDFLIPDTVSLDKYTVECKYKEDSEKCIIKCHLEEACKNENSEKNYSIQSIVEDIETYLKNNSRWPFLNDEGVNLQWKTDQIDDNISPIIKVFKDERNGCGTRIELYPWAIFTNLLDHQIILASSNAVYVIDSCEVFAPPYIEGTFKIGIVDDKNSFLSGTLQLSDDQSFPIPKVSGRIPMNGFIPIMIDCDDYVSFAIMTSKNYKEMRLISVCSSYVINNNSSVKVDCSAWVVCRSANKSSTSFDLPISLESKCFSLAAKGSNNAQAITKWYKMGIGDVQVLPYLILTVEGSIACPVRICDLSEKQRYAVVFSHGKFTKKNINLPCIFMTAQQCDGQVFLTLWDESVPQIVVHNMSQLSLNVIASRSENGNKAISCCIDWNWKFKVSAGCSAYFHTQNQALEKTKFNEYLMFSVENKKHVKQTKWSSGVLLAPCINQLITLPLSQHHIKMAIFRNGFTYVVWIESATADELSAKMIRARLSESFLPMNDGAVIPLENENSDINEHSNLEVPSQLRSLYNAGSLKLMPTNVFIEEVCWTLAGDDELTLYENDIATFCAKNVSLSLSSFRKPNEVAEEVLCHVSIDEYELDNEEYRLRAYDFPVVLLNKKSNANDENSFQIRVDNLLLNSLENHTAGLKVNLYLFVENTYSCSVREVELNLSPLNVYLEDKYLSKVKKTIEKLFSAVMTSSAFEANICRINKDDQNLDMYLDDYIDIARETTLDAAVSAVSKASEAVTAKALSATSKSVNVSDCEIEDANSPAPVATTNRTNENETVSREQAPRDVEKAPVKEKKVDLSTEHAKKVPNYVIIPESVIKRSRIIAKPIRLRAIQFSPIHSTVSIHTSTSFYIALDRSPLKFSEFKKQYLVMTPFELGNILVVHYFFGAIYGTGWAISSLEFVGSPGVLARNLGTGVMDFVSMPIYGISSGPRGLILGIAHGSASLMKHIMAGTLSSVTNFAGSWARTLNRFTLDADDLLQSEQIRRVPPNNITEGILQGLTEFGISLLGGISGIAHHPLQYAASNSGVGNRSLFNSISLGIVNVLTRPLSGAAELVARTGQGIMSHVGWNTIPGVRIGSTSLFNGVELQICNLKYEWRREYENVILSLEAVDAEDIAVSIYIILTCSNLHVIEMNSDQQRSVFHLRSHEFCGSEADPTLICVQKPVLNYKMAEEFSRARIYKFINETNQCFNIKSPHADDNALYLKQTVNVFSFCVNPQIKSFLLNTIAFVKKMDCPDE